MSTKKDRRGLNRKKSRKKLSRNNSSVAITHTKNPGITPQEKTSSAVIDSLYNKLSLIEDGVLSLIKALKKNLKYEKSCNDSYQNLPRYMSRLNDALDDTNFKKCTETIVQFYEFKNEKDNEMNSFITSYVLDVLNDFSFKLHEATVKKRSFDECSKKLDVALGTMHKQEKKIKPEKQTELSNEIKELKTEYFELGGSAYLGLENMNSKAKFSATLTLCSLYSSYEKYFKSNLNWLKNHRDKISEVKKKAEIQNSEYQDVVRSSRWIPEMLESDYDNDLIDVEYDELLNRLGIKDCSVPPFLNDLIDAILQKGISIQGIFRLSGSKTDNDRLFELIRLGKRIDFMNEDVNSLTGILKGYLRRIPTPLLAQLGTRDWGEINNQENTEDTVQAIKILFTKIPPEQYALLKKLFEMLYKISLESEKTKMTNVNLGIVIAPNLISNSATSFMENLGAANDAVSKMIGYYPYIFTDEPIPEPIKVEKDAVIKHFEVFGSVEELLDVSALQELIDEQESMDSSDDEIEIKDIGIEYINHRTITEKIQDIPALSVHAKNLYPLFNELFFFINTLSRKGRSLDDDDVVSRFRTLAISAREALKELDATKIILPTELISRVDVLQLNLGASIKKLLVAFKSSDMDGLMDQFEDLTSILLMIFIEFHVSSQGDSISLGNAFVSTCVVFASSIGELEIMNYVVQSGNLMISLLSNKEIESNVQNMELQTKISTLRDNCALLFLSEQPESSLEELMNFSSETLDFYTEHIDPLLSQNSKKTLKDLRKSIKDKLDDEWLDQFLVKTVNGIINSSRSSIEYMDHAQNLISFLVKFKQKLTVLKNGAEQAHIKLILLNYSRLFIYYSSLLNLVVLSHRFKISLKDYENWNIFSTINDLLSVLSEFNKFRLFHQKLKNK